MNFPINRSCDDMPMPMNEAKCARDIAPVESAMEDLMKTISHNVDLVSKLNDVVSQPVPINGNCENTISPAPVTLYQKLYKLVETVSINNGKLQELIDRLRLEIGDIKLI